MTLNCVEDSPTNGQCFLVKIFDSKVVVIVSYVFYQKSSFLIIFIKQSLLHRVERMAVQNDGSVLRETLVSHLESQDFAFRRIHFEFVAEVKGSLESISTQFNPHIMTASECLFQHSRGTFIFIFKVL